MKFKILAGFGLVLMFLGLALAQSPYSNKFFSAKFPAGDVEYSTQDSVSKDGQKITIQDWNTVNGGAIYSVSYTDFQTERNAEDLDAVIAGEFREFSYSKGDSFVGNLKARSGSGFGLRGEDKLYIYTRAAYTEDHQRLWQTLIMSESPLTLAQIDSFFDSVVIK